VVLGNGGSYQKQYVNKNLDDDSTDPDGYDKDKDLYNNIEVEARDKNGEVILLQDKNGKNPDETGYVRTPKMVKKYFKNKHFFIDPFALTIAQWCYVHG